MPSAKKKMQEFRKCDCGQVWKTRDEFLDDKKVKLVGYQPDFVNHKYNHFLFFHRAKECSQFLGVGASEFSDLRDVDCPRQLCLGREECPGYCTDSLDLRVCSVACRNASDRELAARISKRRLLRSMEATADKPNRPNKPPKKKAKKKTTAKTKKKAGGAR